MLYLKSIVITAAKPLVPVSYTHLDVYKIQVMWCLARLKHVDTIICCD